MTKFGSIWRIKFQCDYKFNWNAHSEGQRNQSFRMGISRNEIRSSAPPCVYKLSGNSKKIPEIHFNNDFVKNSRALRHMNADWSKISSLRICCLSNLLRCFVDVWLCNVMFPLACLVWHIASKGTFRIGYTRYIYDWVWKKESVSFFYKSIEWVKIYNEAFGWSISVKFIRFLAMREHKKIVAFLKACNVPQLVPSVNSVRECPPL
jgi:hypothetical protein